MADVGPPPVGPTPGRSDSPRGPDPTLVSAAAMVFVPDPVAPVMSRDDVHHLLDVLRLRAGQSVIAGDGAGRWVPCRVSPDASERRGRGADPAAPAGLLVPDGDPVDEDRAVPEVTVAFVPTKGDRPEWVVQKLTELGVDRIVPLRSSRSVVRWDGDRASSAVARLRRVAREAAAQCRRAWLPVVDDVCNLDELAGVVGGGVAIADPGGSAPTLERPVVAVGPEGGWDDAERSAFGPTVGLGTTVLRAETAAVAAGTLLCGLRSGVVLPLA